MSRRDEIERLINNYNRRLQRLREKKSLSGFDTPPHILLEIEDIEAEIETLRSEMGQLTPSIEPESTRIQEDEKNEEITYTPKLVSGPLTDNSKGVIIPPPIPELGKLFIKSLEGCDNPFFIKAGDHQRGKGKVGTEKFVGTGIYDIDIYVTGGSIVKKVTIQKDEETIIDLTQELGILLLTMYPRFEDLPLEFSLYPGDGGMRLAVFLKANKQYCVLPGNYIIKPTIYRETRLPLEVDLEVEVKAGQKTIVEPQVWPQKLGVLSFTPDRNGPIVFDIFDQTDHKVGGHGYIPEPQSRFWILEGTHKIVLVEPYPGVIYENVEIKAGEETVLRLPQESSPTVPQTSSPTTNLTTITATNMSVAVVVDSQGVETPIDEMRFIFGHGYKFTARYESIVIRFRGGYVCIPFKNIERIDKVVPYDLEESKKPWVQEVIMEVKLWNGQTIQGKVGHPFGGRPSFSGKFNDLDYNISTSQVTSVFFPRSTASVQSNTVSPTPQANRTVIVKTGTEDEILLKAPRMTWQGNTSSEQHFSLMRGKAKLNIQLEKVRSIDGTPRETSKSVINVHLYNGTTIEGTPLDGWSLAGEIEMGLFLIPLESLISAAFEP